jgi:O-antigen ligase
MKVREIILQKINFENWIYCIIFLLPIYLIKIHLFNLPTNLLELLIGGGFLVWLLNKWSELETFFAKYKKYFFSIGLIFTGLLISMIFNGNYAVALGIIKGWFIFPVLFFAAVLFLLDQSKAEKALRVFYFSALFVSATALLYYFFGKLTFDFRLQAFFNSPNYLAMYLGPAIPIGIFWLRKNWKLYALSLAIILAALFFTKSFAAWAAIVISLTVVFWTEKRFKKEPLLATFSVVLVVIFMFFSQTGTKKLTDALNQSERSSAASRFMIWSVAAKSVFENPIFGIGPGNFQNKYLLEQRNNPPYLEWAVSHPHNLFLAFWLYSGVLGLSGFLFLILFFFIDFFKKQKNALKFMALGMMLCILLQGFLDTTYFKNDLAIIFWLAFAGMIKSNED